jgi:hypothetical protein
MMIRFLTLSLFVVLAAAVATPCPAEDAQNDAPAVSVAKPAPAPASSCGGCGSATTEKKDEEKKDEEKKPAEPACIVKLLMPDENTSPFLTEENFVTTWTILGPFKFKADDFGGDHQQPAVKHEFIKDEAKLDGSQKAPEGTKWETKTFTDGDMIGQVNFDEHYESIDHAAAYAVTWLDAPEAVKDAKLLVGSDDYLQIWINGKLVHTYDEKRRGSEWDQDIIKGIELKKGLNRVVVKCVDVVGGWDFYFRLTDKADRPLSTKLIKPEAKKDEEK